MFGKLETIREPGFYIRHLGRNYKKTNRVGVNKDKGDNREESSCLL